MLLSMAVLCLCSQLSSIPPEEQATVRPFCCSWTLGCFWVRLMINDAAVSILTRGAPVRCRAGQSHEGSRTEAGSDFDKEKKVIKKKNLSPQRLVLRDTTTASLKCDMAGGQGHHLWASVSLSVTIAPTPSDCCDGQTEDSAGGKGKKAGERISLWRVSVPDASQTLAP